MEDKLISLAIHSPRYGLMLKKILEAHGIDVSLQNFSLSDAPVPIGVQIMIKEKDLTLALKIVESAEHFDSINITPDKKRGELLIPVDFNDYALLACKAGFDLCRRLNLKPVILHAYPTPVFNPSLSLDDLTGSSPNSALEEEYNEIEISRDIQAISSRRMKDLIAKIKEEQKAGRIPEIDFITKLEDGVPEDVIKDYCRINSPTLVVMLTREKNKKDEQLIGSVTAEVLDECRVPLFSLPENWDFNEISQIREIVFFCNMSNNDLIAMDTFIRMFDYPVVNITLIPLYEKQEKNIQTRLLQLCDYFAKSYPSVNFSTAIFPSKTFMLDFNNYESQRGIEMIVVPNRHKNALMRLLNPGIAHRLLFERDLPLLALPI